MIHLQHTTRHPRGIIHVTGEHGTVESETMCCVHCRHHWTIQPGSGKHRGHCNHCKGPLCGAKDCFTCVPYEKMLDLQEKAENRGKSRSQIILEL